MKFLGRQFIPSNIIRKALITTLLQNLILGADYASLLN